MHMHSAVGDMIVSVQYSTIIMFLPSEVLMEYCTKLANSTIEGCYLHRGGGGGGEIQTKIYLKNIISNRDDLSAERDLHVGFTGTATLMQDSLNKVAICMYNGPIKKRPKKRMISRNNNLIFFVFICEYALLALTPIQHEEYALSFIWSFLPEDHNQGQRIDVTLIGLAVLLYRLNIKCINISAGLWNMKCSIFLYHMFSFSG
ncbi:hypothetical protein ACJX0J_038644, partial [Zea mays]